MRKRIQHTMKGRKWLLMVSLMLLTQGGVAQSSQENMVAIGEDFFFQIKVVMALLVLIVLLVAFIALHVAVKDVKVFSIPYWWDSVRGLNATDPELHHEYDGVKELDNPVPGYLQFILYGSLVFGVGYLLHYHVWGTGELSIAEYETELAIAKEKYKDVELPDDQIKVLNDPAVLAAGGLTFQAFCQPCHGENLQGITGPNLTDEYWLHGASVKEIYTTITDGVPGKSMVSWKKLIPSQQRLELACYILSLQGSNPSDAKAPEGTKAGEAATEPVLQDSTSLPADSVLNLTE